MIVAMVVGWVVEWLLDGCWIDVNSLSYESEASYSKEFLEPHFDVSRSKDCEQSSSETVDRLGETVHVVAVACLVWCMMCRKQNANSSYEDSCFRILMEI